MRRPVTDRTCIGRPTSVEIIRVDLHSRESQPVINADEGTITNRCDAVIRPQVTAVLGAFASWFPAAYMPAHDARSTERLRGHRPKRRVPKGAIPE